MYYPQARYMSSVVADAVKAFGGLGQISEIVEGLLIVAGSGSRQGIRGPPQHNRNA
jgi:hypothetical protein